MRIHVYILMYTLSSFLSVYLSIYLSIYISACVYVQRKLFSMCYNTYKRANLQHGVEQAKPCEDVIGQVLSPFNLTIQSSALPVWQPLKLADQLSQALRIRTNYIENIRKSHFLATVLKPYLSAVDLAKFWFCQLYTPAARKTAAAHWSQAVR